jgi:hypothetical protein
MQAQYHVGLTREALGGFFGREALDEVVRANVGQDSLAAVFGAASHQHFCDPEIDRSLAYIEDEHRTIEVMAAQEDAPAQRAALGRLLHAVQDFYAHSNYVDLWLAQAQRSPASEWAWPMTEAPCEVQAADPALLDHPHLRIGDWIFWRDAVFYVPLIGPLVRSIWVPRDSHEAMHLDSPARGPRFGIALAMARQRTVHEHRRAVEAIVRRGGSRALAEFHGAAG